MKILMLTDRMEAGGAETHIAQLIRGLRHMGAEVWLLCGGGTLADSLESEGIRIIRAPLPSHSPRVLWSIRRDILSLVRREQFDLLHAHARIPAFLLHGIARHGCAVVVSVHARFRTSPLLDKLCYWGERTIAVSEDLRTYVCEHYAVPAERVHVIPNGVDCAYFSPPVAPRDPQKTTVVFASRLDADCSLGADLLCDLAPSLAERYPSLTVEILGGGSEYERIRGRAEEINRSLGREVVSVCGWVDDVAMKLQNAAVFVGVSRAAIEAGACGCAVVLCGNEGFGGILSKENASRASLSNFCARGETQPTKAKLENSLVALLDDPSRRLKMGDFCRSLMESRFSADQMCRRTYALYHRCLHPRPHSRVVIGGYFGCGNAGDDAILLGVLEALHNVAPAAEIVALSGSPKKDRRRFGVRCVWRKNPIAVYRAFLGAHLFICGGGSLLQNLTSSRSLSYYLGLLRMAQCAGVPCVLSGAGIGPLLGKQGCLRVARALNRCRYVGLRDEDSLRLLASLGVDAGKLHLGADHALLMPLPPKGRTLAILASHGVSFGQGYLCVVLRGGTSTALLRSMICTAVRIICLRHALIPLFPVFDTKTDILEIPSSLSPLGAKKLFLREPADAVALLSGCQTAVVMRLHALVFATIAGVPAVGIPADERDQKIASFARLSGQELLKPEERTVVALVERLETCISSRQTAAPLLGKACADLRHRAQKEIADINELLHATDGKK